MKWNIKLDLWETETYNRNIEPVVFEIASKMDELIGAGPSLGYKPITVVNDLYYGMRIYTPIDKDGYKFGLTVGHLTYGKVAYQFSNLLSQLYTDPRQTTWFSTILAHMSSFWFLDWLHEKWIDNYPGPEYEGDYTAFAALKAEKTKTAYQNVDIMLNLASDEWIKDEVEKLNNGNGYNMPFLFDLLALEILPFFSDETSWRLMGYIGGGTKKPIKDKEDLRSRPRAKPDFSRLHDIVPGDLKPLVEKLCKKLYV